MCIILLFPTDTVCQYVYIPQWVSQLESQLPCHLMRTPERERERERERGRERGGGGGREGQYLTTFKVKFYNLKVQQYTLVHATMHTPSCSLVKISFILSKTHPLPQIPLLSHIFIGNPVGHTMYVHLEVNVSAITSTGANNSARKLSN